MSLTYDDIQRTDDKVRECVEVPEWGGEVYMQTMGGADREVFEREASAAKAKGVEVDAKHIRARMIAVCMCDEKGVLLLPPGDERICGDDPKALSNRSSVVLDRLFEIAQQVSGLGEDAVEDAAKNSDRDPA